MSVSSDSLERIYAGRDPPDEDLVRYRLLAGIK